MKGSAPSALSRLQEHSCQAVVQRGRDVLIRDNVDFLTCSRLLVHPRSKVRAIFASPPEEDTSPGDAEIVSFSDDFLLSEQFGLAVHINRIRLIMFSVISLFTIENVVSRHIDEETFHVPACPSQETCCGCVYAKGQ